MAIRGFSFVTELDENDKYDKAEDIPLSRLEERLGEIREEKEDASDAKARELEEFEMIILKQIR